MGIFTGGGDIKCLYLGTNNISNVYLGEDKVWPISKVDTYCYDFRCNLSGWTRCNFSRSTSCGRYYCCYCPAYGRSNTPLGICRDNVCWARLTYCGSRPIIVGVSTCINYRCTEPRCAGGFFGGGTSRDPVIIFTNCVSSSSMWSNYSLCDLRVDFNPGKYIYSCFSYGRMRLCTSNLLSTFYNCNPQYLYISSGHKEGYICSMQLDIGYDTASMPRPAQ